MKTCWIVERTYPMDKFKEIVRDLKKQAKKIGIKAQIVKTSQILAYYDENQNPKVKITKKKIVKNPDFVIFWNKETILATHLEKIGFNVFNTGENIEDYNNKAKTIVKYANTKIKIPKTIISGNNLKESGSQVAHIKKIKNFLKFPLIVKETKGSLGKEVYLVKNYKELLKLIKGFKGTQYILQEYINTSKGKDVRVNFVGDKIIGAMKRESKNSFKALSNDTKNSKYKLNKKEKKIIKRIMKVSGLQWGGIDFLFQKKKFILCEINSNFYYLNYKSVSKKNIGQKIIESILEKNV